MNGLMMVWLVMWMGLIQAEQPPVPEGCYVYAELEENANVTNWGGFYTSPPYLGCGIAVQLDSGEWRQLLSKDVAVHYAGVTLMAWAVNGVEANQAIADEGHYLMRGVKYAPLPGYERQAGHRLSLPMLMRDWGVCQDGCVSPPWPWEVDDE